MRRASDGRLTARARGYSWRWQRAARRFLKHHPTCAMFGENTRCSGLAEEVDHIQPHKGDLRLFWDKRNWQGLCKSCHSAKTRSEHPNPNQNRKLKVSLDGLPMHWQ